MKNKSVLFIAILSIITLFQNCSREEELILNEDYITVTDLIKYCSKSPCYIKPVEWEGKEVKVKGHIDDNYMLLKDIRNGNNIQISVHYLCDSSCTDSIFKKIILSNNKKNMCYVKGTLQSFEMSNMFNCTVCCKILLHSANDIYFENKY
ncbi:MAG: hypothetical protein QMD02_07330 [Bacteroidales bacterium]|nr:hypothetical protein [Bacteroidales bacterium]